MNTPRNTVTQLAGYDAVVVGARVAGAATAMLLARAGLRVLLLDREKPRTDTLSTHALMRAGVLQLHRWGLLDRVLADGAPIVRETTFHYGARAVPVPVKPRGGVPGLIAPRRTSLDPILVQAAREAGVEVRHGVHLVGLTRGRASRVTGVVVRTPEHDALEIGARWVIGADGVRSPVAQLAGAHTLHEGNYASSTIYGYFEGLENHGYHWYFGHRVSAGVIPTNGGLSCVFASATPRRFRETLRRDLPGSHRELLQECDPNLADRLARCERVGALRGYGGRVGHLRQAWGPGWALVGDAGYFKDPCTAHGITDALRDAELLARAIGTGHEAGLHSYETTRDMLSKRLAETTEAIASFNWTLAELERLHWDLAEAMKTEVMALAALDDVVDVKDVVPQWTHG